MTHRRRSRTASRLVLCLAVAAASVVVGAGTTAAEPRAEAAPRSNRVYFIADSVGLGTRAALPGAFGADWDVTFDGFPALMVHQMESNHVRKAPADVWGDSAVVAGGYNYPHWDPAAFDRQIDSIIAAFEERGVTRVFWVTLREVKPQYITASAWRGIQPYYWYFPTVNDHLRRALLRHDNLTLIDWAAIADRPGLTYDAIHLNAFGISEYTSLVARIVKSGVGRILDGTITRVKVPSVNGIEPDSGAGVAVNLAVTSPRAPGFLTAFPCGSQRPLSANLNYVADQTVSASAVVQVGSDDEICIYNSSATHLIVDVMGLFTGTFVSVGPQRLADTRGSGSPVAGGEELRVQLPAVALDAGAAALNVTAIGGPEAGFVTVYRCGDAVPSTSNLNFGGGAITPNVALVSASADGFVCLRPNRSAHLVVDILGALSDDLVQLPGATRAIDTRSSGGRTGADGGEVVVPTGAAGAAGVFVNVTAVDPAAGGFLTTYACGSPRPPTANLNVDALRTRGNFAIATPDASGRVCVYSNVATDVVVDVMGRISSGFAGLATPVRAFDSRPA